jgi:hypothetical protein
MVIPCPPNSWILIAASVTLGVSAPLAFLMVAILLMFTDSLSYIVE